MEMQVQFRCGHEAIRKVRGQGGPATIESLAWYVTRDCHECWKATEMQRCIEAGWKAELPDLEGSEKQIAWATRIRIASIAKLDGEEVDKAIAALTENLHPVEAHQQMIRLVDDRAARVELLKRVTSARFWIDTRDEALYTLLGHANAELQSVTTVWYAQPHVITLRSGRESRVGGTKAQYTEYSLADVT